jgi:DNA-binding transcriptional MerR regulator
MAKSEDAFRTIGEVSEDLDVPKHVLRFWEARFPQIKPMKRGGGRRFYRPEDVLLLRGIHHLLHRSGFTIRGVQKIFREQGVEAVKNAPVTGAPRATGSPPSAKRTKTRAVSAPPAAALTDSQVATLTKVARELESCLATLGADI